MKYIESVDDKTSLRALVVQDLKELGIKPPKQKKKNKDEHNLDNECVFGNYLGNVPWAYVEGCGPVPKFLIDATCHIENHIDIEGLFRKSGSVARQKELKMKIENGENWFDDDLNPLDLAALVKQFFRELPDPLLTEYLHDTFLKCFNLPSEQMRFNTVFLLCLLLPFHHLSTLKFTMQFLSVVAQKSESNKMDIANLAVCLAPNILHGNSKHGDKPMNNTESKQIQVQTSIVQLLITHSAQIGMVTSQLQEKTSLMTACLPPSEDELERSDSEDKKRKKKRSGSFQGLVNNLSSSFTKWRKDKHNSSGMSNQSAMSLADATLTGPDPDMADGSQFFDLENVMFAEATPKLMRKRKPSNELTAFSASKKKAILQQMPAMSALGGTPFTPAHGLRAGGGHGSSEDLMTPRRKMDKAFNSPATTITSSRVKRHNSRAGCFSPQKSGSKKKGIKGLMRRLSGSRERERSTSPAGSLNTSDAQTAAIPTKKKSSSGLFRRHKRTPSSPARLLPTSGRAAANTSVTSVTSTQSCGVGPSAEQLASALRVDLTSSGAGESAARASPDRAPGGGGGDETPEQRAVIRAHQRGFSSDGTPQGLTALRRGKPNCVTSGLSERARRSLDKNQMSRPQMIGAMDRGGGAGAFDTSPIPRHGLVHGVEDEEAMVTSPGVASVTSSEISRQTSTTSVTSIQVDDQTMSEMDRAFINESLLGDSPNAKTGDGKTEHFKRPSALPKPRAKSSAVDLPAQDDRAAPMTSSLDGSSCSEASDCSTCTVICRDQSRSVAPPALPPRQAPSCAAAQEKRRALSESRSVESLDSGIDTPPLTRALSRQSVASADSAISCATAESRAVEQPMETTKWGDETDVCPPRSDLNASVSLTRADPTRRSAKLHLSEDMCGMLSRAGVLSDSDAEFRVSQTDSPPKEDVVKEEMLDRFQSPLRFPNSTTRRRGASPVRIPTIFAKADAEAAKYRDMGRCLKSPGRPTPGGLRKPNLPISTNLLRSDQVGSALARIESEAEQKPEVADAPADDVITTPRLALRDRQNVRQTAPQTPHIKPPMLNLAAMTPGQILAKGSSGNMAAVGGNMAAMTPVGLKAKKPVKPVKRLRGSPRSPKSPKRVITTAKSPAKTNITKAGQLSPIPTHVTDWDM